MTETAAEHDQRINQAVANFTPAQVRKANACIANGGIYPNGSYRGEWRVRSSDGTDEYVTAIDACSCRAGEMRTYCWHRAAVALVQAHNQFWKVA